VRFEGRALGSPLRLLVEHGGIAGSAVQAAGPRAWSAILEEFGAVDAAMSRFRADSELSALNRGVPRSPSWRLRRALAIAERARRTTGGRFDVRVARALERLGFSGGDGGPVRLPPPSPEARPEPVDLGGLGKGLALRWAAARAAEQLRSVLAAGGGFVLEAGGDLIVRGASNEGAWRVAIEDPWEPATAVAVVSLATGAVATSSLRIQRWQTPGGDAAHHLIDPRTGAPADGGLRAVSVAWPDPAWAEVWSKALFVEGRAGIGPLARSRGLAAWWVTDDGDLEMTPAARPMTIWLRAAGRSPTARAS
jgi:thiamine biosynthesis lipoprotein